MACFVKTLQALNYVNNLGMTKKKGIIAAVVVLVGLGALYGYYGYLYKDARNISTEEASFAIPSSKLAEDYAADITASDAKYLNKTIAITGTVKSAEGMVVMVDPSVVWSFDQKPAGSKTGQAVTIKGRCIGYDEIFGEVKLDQCTISE